MEGADNWSVEVENLVDNGDMEGAITLLESVISKLETLNSSPSDLRLASALTDLSDLYTKRGFSLKADELQTRAFLIKQKAQQSLPLQGVQGTEKKKDFQGENKVLVSGDSGCNASGSGVSASSDDDWETIADRIDEQTLSEAFSPQDDLGMSKLSLGETEFQTPIRRGRGAFLYSKSGLYSDQPHGIANREYSDNKVACHDADRNTENENSRFGTSHVLVLADFPPSTRTTDLEKHFGNFKDCEVAIRWINDTVALAVFQNPSIAFEAQSSSRFPFTVRPLREDDELLSSISKRDLEPPYPRPKTSVRTAQRLIAQGMGQKLSKTKTSFGSSELRKQEEARRNRIVARQMLRDEAWGAD